MSDWTVEQLHDYYMKALDGEKDRIVKRLLADEVPRVVYGSRSINARMPTYLQEFARDWDIYSHTAKADAHKLEKMLDEEFGGDFFEVQPAKHKGTYRVVSRVTGHVIADLTLPDREIAYQVIDGARYATLEEHVKNIKSILSDPTYKFRWQKSEERLQRIKVQRARHPHSDDSPKHVLKKQPPEAAIASLK